MPIDNIAIIVPATGQALNTGWAYCLESNFNWGMKTARIVYDCYASKDLAYAGNPPITQVEVNLSPNSQPAITQSTLVSAGVPAEYDEQGVEISPEVLPVYNTTVIRPEIPGLPELIAENFTMYSNLAQVLDNLLLTIQPEFSGGQIEGA